MMSFKKNGFSMQFSYQNMENVNDAESTLASEEGECDEAQARGDRGATDGNDLHIEGMSKKPSQESTCSIADDKVIFVGTSAGDNADDNGTIPPSSSSSCCRICQNGDSSEQLLENSPCKCRGHLGKAHRKCLVEWVRYKGSNKCEICGDIFADISPPPQLGVNQLEPEVEPPTDNLYFEALEALRWQLERLRPLSRGRRSAMAGVIVFLTLVTFVSAILTVGADRDFRRVTKDPWASRGEQEKTHIIFSVCISFLFFCGTLTFGLALLWLVMECYYATQRRRILQRTAERMVAESARERRMAEEALERRAAETASGTNHTRGTSNVRTDEPVSNDTSEETDAGSIRLTVLPGRRREGITNGSLQIDDEE